MPEPIRTRVRLRCMIQKPGFGQPRFQAATEELARDSATVLVDAAAAPDWFRPGTPVVAGIELPAHEGRAPRILECSARVRMIRREGALLRASLEMLSMAFTGGMP